jgi:DNA-binding transcriptional LysR family regulator
VTVEIRHLRVFLAVLDHGSMTRAAGELGLTQPSVTRAVRELEARLQVTLLNRGGGGASATEAGAEFAPTARRLVESFDSALATPVRPAIKVAYGWGGLIPAMERIVRSWNDDSSRRTVELVRTAQPLVALRNSAADLALMRDWPGRAGYRHLVIYSEPRALVLCASDPLAGREQVGFADLTGYGLVSSVPTGTTPLELWGHPHDRARDRIVGDVEDWLAAIATTTGVFGVTPMSTARTYRHPSVVYRRMPEAPPVQTSLVWPADRAGGVRRLVEHARTALVSGK